MITTSAENAALFVHKISNIDGFMRLEDFSKKHDISHRFMEQLCKKLKEAGILGSKKGKGGGYYLAKEKVSILDVMKAVTTSNKGSESPINTAVENALKNVIVGRKINRSNEQNA